jgi:hypothetical protein
MCTTLIKNELPKRGLEAWKALDSAEGTIAIVCNLHVAATCCISGICLSQYRGDIVISHLH